MLRTPLRRSEWLSAASNADVSIKLEGIQTTFSYKVRGALNAVLKLGDGSGRPALLLGPGLRRVFLFAIGCGKPAACPLFDGPHRQALGDDFTRERNGGSTGQSNKRFRMARR